MSRKIIDIGVEGNDGTGDSIRESFRKTNENFSELYAVFGLGGQIAFTDLADTPDTLTGQGNKVPVVTPTGSAMVFKSLVPGDGISIQQPTSGVNAGNIVFSSLSSKLQDDELPKLAFALDASGQLIGNLYAPTNDADFTLAVGQFNAAHYPPADFPAGGPGIDTFAVNKGYVDSKFVNVTGDTMQGFLNVPANASGSQVPRVSDVITKGGSDSNRTMTAPLFLSDHPGELTGRGTPNGVDDLQAASKYYVDASTYSSNINLYVTTTGSDSQANTPLGKEGRSWAYSYRSINAAAQKAEELMDSAPFETGPYRQLIAFGQGKGFSTVSRAPSAGAASTTRIYFTNNQGSRVDQGALPKPDIVSGKLVVGRTSRAKGFIFLYYGNDSSSPIGEDYFDLQDVEGTFIVGENLEYDQPVKNLNLTIFVESGTYEEDFPIRLPQNCSIVGDELRRVIVRPADRVSKSPWADIWFRRDLTFDGMVITSTEYGYHYLSDPSDRASEPKNNRDMDVFLCNDATILRQISVQGHGGFLMVLDPEGQVLSKSPYFQQGSSFSGSLNKQRFAGGQYVDGFVGNLPFNVISKPSETELLVSGSERAPVTPCSFVIDGKSFKVDTFTSDGSGFNGTRQLIRKNKEFIKAEVIGYIDTELNPGIEFDRTKCARDVGYIVDAIADDLIFNTNYRSIVAAKAYYGKMPYDNLTTLTGSLQAELEATIQAMQFILSRVSSILSANTVAQSRAVALITEIIDIVSNGLTNANAISIPVTSSTTTNVINAKQILEDNIPFLVAEYIAHIAATYPTYVFDEPQYAIELEENIQATIYDLIYGGNTATVATALRYFNPDDDTTLISGQTGQIASGMVHISGLIEQVITSQPILVADLEQTDVDQVLGPAGTVTESASIIQKLGVIRTILVTGVANTPTLVGINTASVTPSLLDARSLLLSSKSLIQSETLTFLQLKYNYNRDICKRDTGYIIDAIVHDVYFGGNLKTVQAGLAYFNGTASSRNVLETQLQNTLDAIDYIRTLIKIIIVNDDVTTRYQTKVPQVIDQLITTGGDGDARVDVLFDELLEIIDNPPNADDARELLTVNKEFIKAEVISYISETYRTTVVSTTSGTNVLTSNPIPGTSNLRVGMPIEFGVSSSTGALQGTKNISGSSVVAAATYTNVPVFASSGVGSGATVTVTKTGTDATYTTANTIITIVSNGTGYKVNDTLKILGSDLGGTDVTNDLIFRAAPSTTILLGGLASSKKYFVKEIINGTQFKISELPNGVEFALTTGTGSVPGQLSYDFAKCSRDVGFIVANTSSDLLYGGTYNTIRAAQSYQTARAGLVTGEQLVETLDALVIAKGLAIDVLNQDTPATNWQALNGVTEPVTQVTDNTLNGASFVTPFGKLMDLVNALIANPSYNPTLIVPGAKSITYPVYRLSVTDPRSPTGAGITNPLFINATTFGSKVLDASGAYFVTVNHAPRSVAMYEKTRYTISGNSNPAYNKTVECTSTTLTSMTFKYVDGDPGVWGAGTTRITYIDDIDLLSPGNTSMCSNDFTQINDLGYGLVATNTGLVEAVSVFSYYCYAAYFANNGGQIRSLNGSNAHGEYGLVSAGSDPLEVPDQTRLRDNMIQVGQVYKAGVNTLDNVKDDLEVYVYNLDFPPYNVSELEINHGAGIIAELDVATLNGGSGYTNGTYLNVPLTGGSGNSAKANIVVSGGQVTTVSLTTGGVRYTEGDILSAGATIGAGSNFSIVVGAITGNGYGRYEVGTVTDVSSTELLTVASASTVTGTGPFYVTLTFPDPGYKPRVGTLYTVSANANTNFNKKVPATASTRTIGGNATVTLEYTTNPGTWGAGGKVWGAGNIIRINISTGGNNDTSAAGLAADLTHNQTVIVRSNQNFQFYEVDDTNPVRPSTALTFVDDPNGAGDDAGVYRVLAYANKDPLNQNLAADASVLSFDTTYDYIKIIPSNDDTLLADPENPAKTLGSTVGDVALAIDRITESSIIDRLNSADMVFAWDGKMHRVDTYIDQGVSAGYGILRFTDITEKSLASAVASVPTGIHTSVSPTTNLDLTDSPTIRIGLAADEFANVIVRISTCRVTGHDFLDIGTGGYNTTNYPSKIYGAPRDNNQTREVDERTRGRVFYVTTDQDGIFRVGRFFTVDQGTGRVTFSASIALSNLDGIGFKRGVAISEFSNDEKFTDGATDAVPTENAIQGYVDLRLGLFRSNDEAVSEADKIGPGFLDRAGILEPTANLNLGGFKLQDVGAPAALTDAATKGYVDAQQLADTKVSVAGKANLDFLMYDGTNWIDVNNNTATITNTSSTSAGGSDLTITRSGNVITFKLVGGAGANNPITNHHINNSAAIAQSKLNMQTAGVIAPAITPIDPTAPTVVQSDLGLAVFNSREFNSNAGWISLKDSTSATTGVKLPKLQYITSGYLLGNRSGSATAPTEITFGQAVTDGDGIKNASFTNTLLGDVAVTGIMTLTGVSPNTYGVFGVTKTGEANRIVRTNNTGDIDVKSLYVNAKQTVNHETVATVANTLAIKTFGGVNVLTASGNTIASAIANINANTTVTGTLSSSGNFSTTGTASITSASSVSATTTVSGTQGNFSTHTRTPLLIASGVESNPGDANTAVGLVQGNWSLVGTSRLIATYADLAEYYEGDTEYEVGTVLIFGGEKEVTTTQLHMDRRVAGVVSNTAAYVMNEGCPGIKVCVALQGRVPVKVVGIVKKGDILVAAAKPGYAIVNNDPSAGTIIGKALAAKADPAPGVVEVAVGRC